MFHVFSVALSYLFCVYISAIRWEESMLPAGEKKRKEEHKSKRTNTILENNHFCFSLLSSSSSEFNVENKNKNFDLENNEEREEKTLHAKKRTGVFKKVLSIV